MPQSTIFESYKYAVLATAAYVRMGARSLDGASFAREAALESQGGGRLPLSQATALFNPADTNAPRWNVMHYYGGDVPSTVDPMKIIGSRVALSPGKGARQSSALESRASNRLRRRALGRVQRQHAHATARGFDRQQRASAKVVAQLANRGCDAGRHATAAGRRP